MRKLFWTLLLVAAFIQTTLATGDSLNYLSPKDTIFLTTDHFGEKIFEHQLEKKQTLFSLAQFYGLHLEEIYFYNPFLEDKNIGEGTIVKVPIPNRAIIRLPKGRLNRKEFVPVYYRVQQGEGLFRIAKKYFNLPMDTLVSWNQLDTTGLEPNQILHVGFMSIKGVKLSSKNTYVGPLWKRSNVNRSIFLSRYQDNIKKQKGAAYWQEDMGLGNTDLMVLHRTAPMNSIVSILNPMSRKRIYARVIGSIPENAYNKEVIIVVSKNVANLLGGRDRRFFVELEYALSTN